MKFYLAAHFADKPKAREARNWLVSMGHESTSRWLDEEPLTDPKEHDVRQALALKDVADVRAADAFVFLNPPEAHRKGTGGRRVEFGMAVLLDMPIFIIGGPSENVFDDLPNVKIVPDVEQVGRELTALQNTWLARPSVYVMADDYQEWTGATASYPGVNTGSPSAIFYPLIGKVGELGETIWFWLERAMDAKWGNKELKSRLIQLFLDAVSVGQRAEDLKRPIREGKLTGFPEKLPDLTGVERTKVADEASDEDWYHARYLKEVGILRSEVFRANVIKLLRRKREGTIHGTGSER